VIVLETSDLKVKIEPKLKLKFHEEILKRCGVQKGCFNKCIEEAIELWLKEKEPRNLIKYNPVTENE